MGKKKSTTEEFIEKSKKIHGDKYTYSNVVYENSQTHVLITCPIHGDFKMRPNDHLSGKGCGKCYGRNKTTEEWIEQVKNVYNEGSYTFDKTKYISARGKLIVTCTKHGDFETVAHDFSRGHGCPVCNESKLERKVRKYLEHNKINFIYQKRFEWMGIQSVDFFLPDYNTAIECQGIQHFVEREFFNKRETLENRISRDAKKKSLCEEHSIRVLYFLDKKFVKHLNGFDEYFTNENELKIILKI